MSVPYFYGKFLAITATFFLFRFFAVNLTCIFFYSADYTCIKCELLFLSFPWLFPSTLENILKVKTFSAVNTPGVLSCPWRFPAVPESWQVWGWPKWKQGPWFTACPAVYNKPRQNAICLASSLSLFKPKENILHFIFKSPVYQARVLRLFRRGWKAVPGVSYSGVSRTGCSSVAGDTWLSSQRGLFFAPCGNLLLSVN